MHMHKQLAAEYYCLVSLKVDLPQRQRRAARCSPMDSNGAGREVVVGAQERPLGPTGLRDAEGTHEDTLGADGTRVSPPVSFGDTPLQKAESATLAGRLNGMKVAPEMTPYRGPFLPWGRLNWRLLRLCVI
jgi:hypothetical protein